MFLAELPRKVTHKERLWQTIVLKTKNIIPKNKAVSQPYPNLKTL